MGKYYASNAHKEAFKRQMRIKEYTKKMMVLEEKLKRIKVI